MKRHAVIISNPGESGQENYCVGVLKDVPNYRSFLLSPMGGSWREPEVSEMSRPSAADVHTAARNWLAYDYVLVIFSGHGYWKLNSTWMELREGHEIDSNDLRLATVKQTIILDCCRMPVAPARMTALDEKVAKRAAPTLNAADCRAYYDKRIEECATQPVVLYACDVGEPAGDESARGGTYSSRLLQASRAWADDSTTDTTKDYNILSVARAHETAADLVRNARPQQNPQIEKPRSSPYYPFCVVA